MVEALRKLLLAGLGTLDLTEEKLKAVFSDLVARGEMSEKEARELITNWTKRATEQRGRMKEDLEQAVNRTLQAMGLAKRSDVDALSARLAELERRMSGAGDTPPDVPPPATGTSA